MQANATPFVYISPYYEPEVHSGANRRLEELIARFERDYRDTFTLIVTKGKTPRGYRGKLIEVNYNFDHRSKFRAMREIGKALNTLPPSIVICESIPIPFRALRRHVHFQVAYDFRYFTSASKGLFYRLMFSRFLKRQWRRSEHIVTCSDFSIRELEKYVGYDPRRIVKSFFGIDERVLEIAKIQAPKKDIDIIYVAHFEKRKNHEPLIRAVASLDKSLRVVFNGRDNGLEASLSALCRELGLTNVTFSRGKSDAELWDMYRRSRVFAYPSLYEGFGIPLIEAIALQVPVACSDIDVFHEVGGSFPAYFNPHDPNDIAEKLRTLMEHPTPYDSEKVYAHLEQFFWENIYQKFVRDLVFSSRPALQKNSASR